MNLHLYHYNNYYNRQIKSPRDISQMDEFEIYVEYNVNFNPNDGVTTEHVIGGLTTYQGAADYCIAEEDNNVISRWFVIENKRTRAGQYNVQLKRDSIADYANAVFNAPCFVEKGWVPNSDPAIFNKENLTFNQIKKKEVLLKDSTQMPWLVGYYNKEEQLSATVPTQSLRPDITVSGLSNWTYYKYFEEEARVPRRYDVTLTFQASDLPPLHQAHVKLSDFDWTGNFSVEAYTTLPTVILGIPHYTIDTDSALWGLLGSSVDPNVVKDLTGLIRNRANQLDSYLAQESSYNTMSDIDSLVALQGTIIFDSDTGEYWRIGYTYKEKNVSGLSIPRFNPQLTSNFGYEMYNIYSTVDTETGGIYGERPTKNGDGIDFRVEIKSFNTVTLTRERISSESLSVTISPAASGQTRNLPYNIFAIPYGNLRVQQNYQQPYFNFDTNPDDAIRICQALIKNYSGASAILHDLQLLPYCPVVSVRNNIKGKSDPRLQLADLDPEIYTFIRDSNDNPVGVVFHSPDSSGEFSIDYEIEVNDVKISNETEFCRLVSPNWNGIFEFSPAKNRGVSAFDVDVQFRPYQPYIHVSPRWSETGLYGIRDNDAIGLIAGGDFGLTLVSDAWSTYERQNKNYQQIFDRQIQNLEVNNTLGIAQQVINAGVGSVSGGMSGAVAGSFTGAGPYGAAAGALMGSGASAIGGVADLGFTVLGMSEAMDYTKDLFGYQMGTIKALPATLTKVSSFNPNNTIFPILEFYGCTDEETEALKQKIKYNGMTIGRIGKLGDFVNPISETYVKGQIILLDIGDDTHLANDISNEIYKGVRVNV